MPTNNQTNAQLKTYQNIFVHNTLQNLVEGIGKWFVEDFYKDFREVIVSTYFKAIQEWKQDNSESTDGVKFVMNTPSLLIDPMASSMTLENNTGYSMWRFHDFSPYIATTLYKPFLQTDKVEMYQITNRIQFGLDAVMTCESVYQAMDFKAKMLQWCHGLNKPFSKSDILPIKTFVILPKELRDYIYENYYTGESFTIDIKQYFNDTSICDFQLISTINQTELILVFYIYPMLTLQSLTDTSILYGGPDLPTHSITASFQVETEYNTHLILRTDWKLNKIDLNCRFGYVDSIFNNQNNSAQIVFPNQDPFIPRIDELKYKGKLYYIASEDHPTPWTLTINEPISLEARKYTIINTKYGQLIFGKGTDGGGFYIEETTPNIIEFSFLEIKKDDVIEIVIYE